jgi:hypothetical protein
MTVVAECPMVCTAATASLRSISIHWNVLMFAITRGPVLPRSMTWAALLQLREQNPNVVFLGGRDKGTAFFQTTELSHNIEYFFTGWCHCGVLDLLPTVWRSLVFHLWIGHEDVLRKYNLTIPETGSKFAVNCRDKLESSVTLKGSTILCVLITLKTSCVWYGVKRIWT